MRSARRGASPPPSPPDALCGGGGSLPDAGWTALWQRAERAAREVLDGAAGEGFWEGGIARTLVDALPDGALLHVASSMPIRDVDAFASPRSGSLRVLASRGANGIDGTLATACGEALAWDGPSAALLGDLACLHDVGGLLAARALGVDTTFVVINNGGGGIFSFLPIAAHPTAFEPAFLTPRPLNLEALCAAAGIPYTRAQSLAELRRSLGGLRVIEAIVDREDNLARHRAAWEAAVRAVDISYSLEEACPSTG